MSNLLKLPILACDIGGTHTRMGLFDENGTCQNLTIYPSHSYQNLENILKEYLSDKTNIHIEIACIAVAGPIYEGVCKLTNLPWVVDANSIGKDFSFSQVYLLNDLEANAHAVQIQPSIKMELLYPGMKKDANRVVVSPGTGLGEAGIYWDGEFYHPFASEGGHADFAPVGDLQVEYYQYLKRHYEHVSYEIALSGPGLSHIYEFLCEKGREEEGFLIEQKKTQDLSMLISTHGVHGTSQICIEALDLFCDLLAQESANMALKLLAYGGVYLGGGIVPKILPKLQQSRFLERYFQKGAFRAVLEKMPLFVITDDKAALKGAAHFASRKLANTPLKAR